MRKFKIKKAIPYIIALVLGLMILPFAIKAAFVERGYIAVGGEMLLPLLFVLIVAIKSEIKEVINEIKGVWN
ncbi:MAG: hypothetical protein K0S74_1864 [Chlamydiales bacterium]|jgi:hypothetical protein|nr:hypothetical protein [Chlamydiales bacterium]